MKERHLFVFKTILDQLQGSLQSDAFLGFGFIGLLLVNWIKKLFLLQNFLQILGEWPYKREWGDFSPYSNNFSQFFEEISCTSYRNILNKFSE